MGNEGNVLHRLLGRYSSTARVITTADLVLIKAVGLCKYGRTVQNHPDIGEMLYTTLVKRGARPEEPGILMLAILFSHFNVVRAMAAAGVDVLRIFNQEHGEYAGDMKNPEPFKFLVEELGYRPSRNLGQWENAAYLVSHGADPSAISDYDIEAVIQRDHVKTLEWLMQNRVDLQATEILERRLESHRPAWTARTDIFGTVELLLRQGADPLFIRNDKMLLERAVENQLWEVAGMMLTKLDPSAAADYQLLKDIATGRVPLFLPSRDCGNPNAFNGAPLRVAVSRNNTEAVATLLERGCVPTESTLRAAIRNREHIATFRLLLPFARNYGISSLGQDAYRAGNFTALHAFLEEAEKIIAGRVAGP
ncbi:hypothetical protein HK104_010900 [Borealophlyctis nickersoniae]|nr:hypothetical protein HK104_010900 [Borealophlyctis nickersoniae]